MHTLKYLANLEYSVAVCLAPPLHKHISGCLEYKLLKSEKRGPFADYLDAWSINDLIKSEKRDIEMSARKGAGSIAAGTARGLYSIPTLAIFTKNHPEKGLPSLSPF